MVGPPRLHRTRCQVGRSDDLGPKRVNRRRSDLKNVASNNPLDFTSLRLMRLNAQGLQVGVAFLNLGRQPGSASHSIEFWIAEFGLRIGKSESEIRVPKLKHEL